MSAASSTAYPAPDATREDVERWREEKGDTPAVWRCMLCGRKRGVKRALFAFRVRFSTKHTDRYLAGTLVCSRHQTEACL